MLGATLDGYGIGEISWIIAQKELEIGSLVEVLPKWSLVGNRIYLVSPPGRATIPRVRELAECITRAVAR